MTAEHNHPPRCCCQPDPWNGRSEANCPACPEHGDLAQAECPSCHTTNGHPHTDYCQHAGTKPKWQIVTTNATGQHNQPHPNDPCPTEWTAGLDNPWHRCTLPAPHHPAISHLCWCGDCCELGMILDENRDYPGQPAPGSYAWAKQAARNAAPEATCGFRSLDNPDLICSYPPHPIDQPHSWQDGGDPRGWRNAIDPNKP